MEGWSFSERKPVVLELAALREAIPVIAKAKITDLFTWSKAWKVLDMEYGDVQEIREKLKDQVRSIKIKATGDSAKLVELYHTVQTIAAKIKASRSLSLLVLQRGICIWWSIVTKELEFSPLVLWTQFNIVTERFPIAKK